VFIPKTADTVKYIGQKLPHFSQQLPLKTFISSNKFVSSEDVRRDANAPKTQTVLKDSKIVHTHNVMEAI
jgi:hypothetical protein